jgi:hypothetical protein
MSTQESLDDSPRFTMPETAFNRECGRMNIRSFKQALRQGIDSKTWLLMDQWIAKESSLTYKDRLPNEGAFPDEILTEIINRLADDKTVQLEGIHKLLLIIEQNWGILCDSQLKTLRDPLLDVFVRSNDEMSQFLVVEIFGNFYTDANALENLKRMETISNSNRRQLIPLGYYYIVCEADNYDLSNRAYLELVRMEDDLDESVRKEALYLKRKAENCLQRFC